MTEDNDLFDIFDNDAHHLSRSDEAQVEADLKHHQDKTAPPLPPTRRRQVRIERRRRRKKVIVRYITGIILLGIIGVIGYGGYSLIHNLRQATQNTTAKTSDTLDYPGPGSGSVEVTFEEGEGTAQFAKKLVDAGVVRTAGAFTNAVQAAQAENKLQAGTFVLKKRMAAADVVTIITDASKISNSLIVRSGETVDKVIENASRVTGITTDTFNSVMADANNGVLPAVAQNNWEGWFEPGTYNIKDEKDAATVLKQMVNKRIKRLQDLNVPQDQWETILNKASIIEGEANSHQYYGKVARVIENRLAANMTLGMDSINGYGFKTNGRNLTQAQLDDASNPYNSRIHTGLPPTPINNPGTDAIKAALNPEEGDWLYFVTVNLDTGETKFTASADEFEQFAQEYKQWEANN